MRKRQKPYVLITLLVFCGGLVAFMNTPPSKGGSDQDRPPQTGNKDVNVPSKSDVASKVASDMKGVAPSKPPSMMAQKMGQDTKDDGPVVVKQKYVPYTPKPSESQTAGQWYENDAAKSYSGDKAAAAGDKKK